MKKWKIVLTSIFGILILGMLSSCSENEGVPSNDAAEWVDITHQKTYMTDYNTIISYAVVKNVLDVPIENAFIVMTLKNAKGEDLETVTCNTSLMPAGASIPIRALFPDSEKIEWQEVEARFWKGEKIDKRAVHTDFRLQNVTLEDDPGSSYIKKVTGTIVNTGDTKAKWVNVLALFFNDQDEIVASARSGVTGRDLAPGEKGDFSAGTNSSAGDIERVDVTVIAKSPEWHDVQSFKN